MKKPSDGDGGESSSDSKAEEIAQKILDKLPKILIYCGVGLAVIIVAALIIMKFSSSGH